MKTRNIKICFNAYLDEMLIQEDLLDILPMVEEANAISQELDKKVFVDTLRMSINSQKPRERFTPKISMSLVWVNG